MFPTWQNFSMFLHEKVDTGTPTANHFPVLCPEFSFPKGKSVMSVIC